MGISPSVLDVQGKTIRTGQEYSDAMESASNNNQFNFFNINTCQSIKSS